MNARYKPRQLIEGYRVDKEFTGKTIVAVPEQKVASGVDVIYHDETMHITPSLPRLKEIEFTDRYGRGKYKLFYYEWKPCVQVGLDF